MYIIGIDGGSQSTKLIMYNIKGEVVCEGKGNLKPLYTPNPDTLEHPDDDIWTSLCEASKNLMSNFDGDVKDIVGIGLGSIRCCRAVLKSDGTLASQILNWQDKRVTAPYVHDNKEAAYVTSMTGYLSNRLTGKFIDTPGNCFGQWPIDFETWDWSEDPKVLEKFNIPREMLFDMQMPGTVVGTVTKEAAEATGFPVGLKVIITTSDKAVEMLGAGAIDEKTAVISLGTYIALMASVGTEIPKGPQSYWAILSSMPNKLIYEGYGIRRGMWTVSWLRDLLGDSLLKNAKEAGLSPEDFLNREASKIPAGSEGLITVLDWLTNPWEPHRRGIMLGFNAQMDYAYMYRSILESIALTLKNNYDNMCDEMKRHSDELIITGGGSNSDLFMQIFADVFNMPTKRNVINGCASLGAAINTAVATGVYESYEEAVEKMVKIKDTFYPIKENADMYQKLNQGVFKDITQYTDVILKKTHAIFNDSKEDEATQKSWSLT